MADPWQSDGGGQGHEDGPCGGRAWGGMSHAVEAVGGAWRGRDLLSESMLMRGTWGWERHGGGMTGPLGWLPDLWRIGGANPRPRCGPWRPGAARRANRW